MMRVVIVSVLCSSLAVAQQTPIKIGAAMSMTGPSAIVADAALEGIKLQMEETNAAGGLLGRKLALEILDTGLYAESALSAMTQLIEVKKVSIVIGPNTINQEQAMAPRAEKEGALLISLARSIQPPGTSTNEKLVFRVAQSATLEGWAAAERVSALNAKRIGVIASDLAYTKEVLRAFEMRLKQRQSSAEVVTELVPVSTTDFSPYIQRQMQKKPEAVFTVVCNVKFIAEALTQAYFRKASHGAVVGCDGISPFVLKELQGRFETDVLGVRDIPFGGDGEAGDGGNGCGGGGCLPRAPEWRALKERFDKQTSGRFSSGRSAAPAIGGYIAMRFLVEAVKKAKTATDPNEVAKALRGLQLETPLGVMTVGSSDQQVLIGVFFGRLKADRMKLQGVEYLDAKRLGN